MLHTARDPQTPVNQRPNALRFAEFLTTSVPGGNFDALRWAASTLKALFIAGGTIHNCVSFLAGIKEVT
jgi:hypothetical protein